VRARGGARPPTPAQRLAPRGASMPSPRACPCQDARPLAVSGHVLFGAACMDRCSRSLAGLSLAQAPACRACRAPGAFSGQAPGWWARQMRPRGPHPARQVLAPYSHFDIPVIGQAYLLFRARLMPPFTYEPGAESLETRLFAPEDVPFDQARRLHPLLPPAAAHVLELLAARATRWRGMPWRGGERVPACYSIMLRFTPTHGPPQLPHLHAVLSNKAPSPADGCGAHVRVWGGSGRSSNTVLMIT
jgi:hypothetical protein